MVRRNVFFGVWKDPSIHIRTNNIQLQNRYINFDIVYSSSQYVKRIVFYITIPYCISFLIWYVVFFPPKKKVSYCNHIIKIFIHSSSCILLFTRGKLESIEKFVPILVYSHVCTVRNLFLWQKIIIQLYRVKCNN